MKNFKNFAILSIIFSSIALIGCGNKISTTEVGDMLTVAQTAIESAKSEDSEKLGTATIGHAENLLDKANKSLKSSDYLESWDYAFQAETKAKIALIEAQREKNRNRLHLAHREYLQALEQEMELKLETARTRQMISEELARQAEFRADQAELQMKVARSEVVEAERRSKDAIRRSKIVVKIEVIKNILDLARDAGALTYAVSDYRIALEQIDQLTLVVNSKRILDQKQFESAITKAEESETIARRAQQMAIVASAKAREHESQVHAGAELAVARARTEIGRAEKVNAFKHASDELKQAHSYIRQANIAMKREEYSQAIKNAKSAEMHADTAYKISAAAEQKRLEREQIEEKIAQAKDQIFKAEETFIRHGRRIEKLSPTVHAKGKELLESAKRSLADGSHEVAIASATESRELLEKALSKAKAIRATEQKLTKVARKLRRAKVIRTTRGVLIRLGQDLFKSGEIELNRERLSELQQLAKIIQQFPELKIRVEAHSDSVGDEATNQKLTEKRAKAFSAYLVDVGNVSAERIETVGMGEKFPIANNMSDAGKARNRRVDTIFLTKE